MVAFFAGPSSLRIFERSFRGETTQDLIVLRVKIREVYQIMRFRHSKSFQRRARRSGEASFLASVS